MSKAIQELLGDDADAFVVILGAVIYTRSITYVSNRSVDGAPEMSIVMSADPNVCIDAAQHFLSAVEKRF
jgi:hypothetical protein